MLTPMATRGRPHTPRRRVYLRYAAHHHPRLWAATAAHTARRASICDTPCCASICDTPRRVRYGLRHTRPPPPTHKKSPTTCIKKTALSLGHFFSSHRAGDFYENK